MYPEYSLSTLCGLFGKSRQGWYSQNWYNSKVALEEEVILKEVKEIRIKIKRIGVRKLYHMLQSTYLLHDIKMGRDKLFSLLRRENLLIQRTKRGSKTTNSYHWLKKYPYLIENVEVIRPEQVWVSDITYIRLTSGFAYLSFITDAYSRKIMGYCLHPTLEAEGCLKALRQALTGRLYPNAKLIHHSDRGVQYCSFLYTNELRLNNIDISMTLNGTPYENALAESINSTAKVDFDLKQTFNSYEEALSCVNQMVTNYNGLRPHGSIDYLTPNEAHLRSGKLKNRWKKKIN